MLKTMRQTYLITFLFSIIINMAGTKSLARNIEMTNVNGAIAPCNDANHDGENAQKLSGIWAGTLKVGVQNLGIVFHLSQNENGNDVCTMDSPNQGVTGIATTVNHLSADSLSVSVQAIGMTYTGKLAGNTIKGTFVQNGMRFPLDLEVGVEEKRRPQMPVSPYPYATEEVKFTNVAANATLAGTLTYPVGYEAGKRVPVALLVTGSGSQNRDEEVFDHKPFLIIADYFAHHGIATLRYDDRGFAESTGDAKSATTRDFAEDAKAGLAFLREQGKFGLTGVLGHSEGGTIAFMLGGERLPDFVISLAGVGVKGDTALVAQVNRMAELMGVPSQITTTEHFRTNAAMANNPWVNYILDYDPCADISATKCPVMALNGANDVQVVPHLNLEGIGRCLPDNPNNVIKVYPGLNHLFQSCTTGLPDEYVNIEETISPMVLQDMAEWINKLSK